MAGVAIDEIDLVELSADETAFILEQVSKMPGKTTRNNQSDSYLPVNCNHDCQLAYSVDKENVSTCYISPNGYNSNRLEDEKIETIRDHFCTCNGVSQSDVGSISCQSTPKGQRVTINLKIGARRCLKEKDSGLMVYYKDRWFYTFDYVDDTIRKIIESNISNPETKTYDDLINFLKDNGFSGYNKLYIETTVRPKINDERVTSNDIHLESVPYGQTKCLIIDLSDHSK